MTEIRCNEKMVTHLRKHCSNYKQSHEVSDAEISIGCRVSVGCVVLSQNDLQRQLVQMNNPAHHRPPPARGVAAENQPKFQRSFIDGDFDFVSVLELCD